MLVVDGGYLSWVYGTKGSGWSSWASARSKYSLRAGAVMVMDGGRLLREDYYEPYKAHRREEMKPEKLERKRHVERFREILLEDGSIDTRIVPGYEADDLIAVLAMARPDPIRVIGVDKDLLQLGKKVKMERHTGEQVWLEDFIKKQPQAVMNYIRTPADVVLVLALLGDSSDNVPRLVPPYQLSLMVDVLRHKDPWMRAVQLFGFEEVSRNLYLTILPGPWCYASLPSEEQVLQMVRENTYHQQTLAAPFQELVDSCEGIYHHVYEREVDYDEDDW
jgi:hypothetical protein